MTTMVLNRDIR